MTNKPNGKFDINGTVQNAGVTNITNNGAGAD